MAGKGSRQRPTNTAAFESNWERIFGGAKEQDQGLSVDPAAELGMGTASLEGVYRGQPNAAAEGAEAPNE